MAETVLYDKRGRVAWLTLNRPESANTYDLDLVDTLQKHAMAAANDAGVRVLVVTGAGRHFCGGADLTAWAEHQKRRSSHVTPIDAGVALDWVPKPVVAAINGAALGGGCEIALSCDFRFMAETARIGLPEIRFGGLPGMGGIARAARVIGMQAAKRLVMTGEPVSAAEAERIGLADKICPPESLIAEVEQFAELLASRAPYAQRAAKLLLGKALEVNLATALEFERTVIATMGTPEERAEAREEAARTSATYAAIFGKGEKA